MTTRSSSSSSSSGSEDTTTRIRDVSETSGDASQATSRHREQSATNTIDGSTIADTATLRSSSPTASHASTGITGTPYDVMSIATATTGNTTTSNNTAAVQRQVLAEDTIPIIRPPILPQLQSGTGIGVFGPQRPSGYPTQPPVVPANIVRPSGGVVTQQQSGYQASSATTTTTSQPAFAQNIPGGVPPRGPPIHIDVGLAQQQRAVAPEISPYGGSTTSTSSGSFASPGNNSFPQQQQQSQFNVGKDGAIIREEFQQWSTSSTSTGQQQQQQQQHNQFANQISHDQVYNELLGPDAFKDVILNIDYGAIEAFNSAYQSGGDFSGGQLPPGIDVRPAYTTVDSLNYEQHMFNTARTVNATGGFASFESGSSVGGGGDGAHFDVAKAMFTQADLNRDGAISRDEFRQWAAGGIQPNVGQSFSSSETSYPTPAASYASSGGSFHNQPPVLDAANPTVANILNQSGLSRVMQGTR